MAALTDGTPQGTIPASPVVPAPVTADTSTGAGNPITGNSTTAQIPPAKSVSTVSSKPAANLVTTKIAPTITTANTAIANNNPNLANGLPGDSPQNKYNTATGQLNPNYVAPTTSTPPASTTSPAEDAIANTPDAGYKFAYSSDGTRTQIPLTDSAATHGLFDTNPTSAPTTPAISSASLPSGTTFKQYSDGTFGTFDPTGKYLGPATQQEYQTATDAESIADAYRSIINGTYPLSATQQAAIIAAQQAGNQVIQAQVTTNANVMGGMSILMNLRGLSGDTVGLSTMAQNATAGAQRIIDLQAKLTADVANMTEQFNNDNLTALKAAYDSYTANAKALQDNIDKVQADAVAAAAAAQKTKDDQRTYDLQVAQFKQTQSQDDFENAFKTEQEAFDEKYKNNDIAIREFTAGMGANGSVPGAGSIQSAALSPTGGADPASQATTLAQISQTYGPMTAVAIKSLANYTMNPTDWSTRSAKGMSRENAVALAKMYDPTYDDTQYAARASYVKALTSTANGTVGGAINSANKTINHLSAYAAAANQLANGASETVNSLLNPVLGLDSNRKALMTTADTEGQGVADEMTKFLSQSNGDVGQVASWKDKMNSNTPEGGVHGVVQGAITLMAGQLETLSEQFTSTMGKPPPTALIGPSAMANLSKLKNEGYTVDIPGVLYTDVNAYTKSDPDASANLDSARQQLIQANDPNNPPTPENILQLAQMQQ